MSAAKTIPLTLVPKEEGDRLAQCEAVIDKGLKSFVEVGKALLEIRDDELYKADYDTFDQYCQKRWGMKRIYAFYLMATSQIASNLFTMVNIKPTNERQVRPLLALKTPELQAKAWEIATEDGTRPTATKVKAAVEQIQPPKKRGRPKGSKNKSDPKVNSPASPEAGENLPEGGKKELKAFDEHEDLMLFEEFAAVPVPEDMVEYLKQFSTEGLKRLLKALQTIDSHIDKYKTALGRPSLGTALQILSKPAQKKKTKSKDK